MSHHLHSHTKDGMPPCVFDAQLAYAHTEALCFPRRVGTPAERQAARYILREFTRVGLTTERHHFRISHFPVEIGNRIVFALGVALVLAGALVIGDWPWIAAGCFGLALVFVNAPWTAHGVFGRHLPPFATSANLVGTQPDSPCAAPARVIFMAHYDTKSQMLPTGIRVGLVMMTTLACLFLFAVAAWGVVDFGSRTNGLVLWGATLVAGIGLVLLILNLSGNHSPGALDNGSAVGTLLSLAHSWQPRADAPVEVVWVASGSEEVGLDGARDFLARHESWWREKPTLLINLESVGAGTRVFLSGQADAQLLAEFVADELQVPRARLRVLGAGMDHQPFAARGLAAVSILGDVVRKSMHFHSRRDNMSQIEHHALHRAGTLALHLAWHWAVLHQPNDPGSDGLYNSHGNAPNREVVEEFAA